jgi:hypothetical protein
VTDKLQRNQSTVVQSVSGCSGGLFWLVEAIWLLEQIDSVTVSINVAGARHFQFFKLMITAKPRGNKDGEIDRGSFALLGLASVEVLLSTFSAFDAD